ncbi:MAG: thiol:disulfide interchange protein DsbA/DsbL [Gammaproteobacteria bacterium]|nr:thiol:disulfide interchange protein DsbA/DsbL [Gammaproteobacteria bacterium]
MHGFRQLWVSVFILMMTGQVFAAGIKEGVSYERINPPVAKSTSGKTIEVVEMFWYGCPHCFQFEPKLHKWLKKKPANVKFVRVPATFRPLWKLHARAFYAAEVLGVSDKMHKQIFDTYHLKRDRLDTKEKLRALFVKNGVKASDFDDVFHSFAVETKLARADDLTRRYGISGVPSMIVNGKYRAAEKHRDGPSMLDVVDHLIKKEK